MYLDFDKKYFFLNLKISFNDYYQKLHKRISCNFEFLFIFYYSKIIQVFAKTHHLSIIIIDFFKKANLLKKLFC